MGSHIFNDRTILKIGQVSLSKVSSHSKAVELYGGWGQVSKRQINSSM